MVPRSDGVAKQAPLDGIQWLRAAAAFLVVVEHTKNAISTEYLRLAPDRSPLSIFPFSAGVDIFFVISGFIMAYANASLFGRPGGWRPFLIRRIARIVPLYWLMTSVMALSFAAIGSRMWLDSSWSSIAASYLFIPAANAEGAAVPLFVIGWTLNHEMAFYAIFAAFIGFRRPVALALIAGTVTTAAVLGLVVQPSSLMLRFWSDPIILEFAAGIGLFALHRGGWLNMPTGLRLVLALSATGLLALHPAYAGPWRPLIWGVPALMLVAAALPSRPPTAGTHQNRHASLAGDLSYAIYLAHLPIVLIGQHLLRRLPPEGWMWCGLYPALVGAGTLVAAYLLHRVIERPIIESARPRTSH